MSTNDITGDRLISKPTTSDYAKGYDLLFNKSRYKYKGSAHIVLGESATMRVFDKQGKEVTLTTKPILDFNAVTGRIETECEILEKI